MSGWQREYPHFAKLADDALFCAGTLLRVMAVSAAFAVIAGWTGWVLRDYALTAGGMIIGARHLGKSSTTQETGE